MMNKVHNVSAVSICCFLVKKENWIDLDEDYRGGLVSADHGLRARQTGKLFVFTPHATAVRARCPMLLSGVNRDEEDVRRFREAWGETFTDPCYSPRFRRDKANYRF